MVDELFNSGSTPTWFDTPSGFSQTMTSFKKEMPVENLLKEEQIKTQELKNEIKQL